MRVYENDFIKIGKHTGDEIVARWTIKILSLQQQ